MSAPVPRLIPASQLWLSALDCVPDAIAITDLAGRYEFVNAAFTRINGYSLEEVLGSTPSLLKSGLTDPAVHVALWQEIRAGRTFTATVINRRKSGEHYQAELTVVPLLDEAGAVTHFVSTHRDLTSLLDAQAALSRSGLSLRALVDGMLDAIVVHREGHVVFVNPAALKLLGYQRKDELLKQSIRLLMNPDDYLRGRHLPGNPGPIKVRLVRNGNVEVTVEVLAQQLIFDDLPATVLQAASGRLSN